jgi:subtilisin family serine protease
MTEVWGVTTGSPDVVVAVLDTGIDAGHPEFEGRLLAGYDFVDEDDDPQDDVGHGTLVTGVLAATGDNAFGIAGMDWHCRILPIKVVNYDGTVFDLAQGIDLAASRQADVVNMSLGNFPESAILDAALTHAKGAGCVLVSSAGNGHSADKSFPGASLAQTKSSGGHPQAPPSTSRHPELMS